MICLAIIIVLILLLLFLLYKKEDFTNPESRGYVRIYDEFKPEKSFQSFEFTPLGRDPKFLKYIVRIPVKYIDIGLVPIGTNDDKYRKIELWGMYPRDQTASSLAEGVHHSAYQEPDWAHRAISTKYKLIMKILPGQFYSGPAPVLGFKKVMILATI